ncbi:hypothetical protein EV182_003452, partial [Spiromyces aspiralis]
VTRPDDFEGMERLLQNQRQTQSELTDQLLKMAESLKSNSLTFGEMLTQDEKLMEETGEAISSNLGRLKTQGGRLGIYRSKAWKTTGFTWGLVFFVILTTFIMILFIKVVPKRS